MNPDPQTTPIRRLTSLRFLIPSTVALFVILGSFSLLMVFERHREAENRRAFGELVRINTDFILRTKIPLTTSMASRLSEIIGAEVHFRQSASGQVISTRRAQWPDAAGSLAMDGTVRELPDRRWIAGVEGDQGVQVIFIREPLAYGLSVVSVDAWLALGVFWLLSLALGIALSRWVTRPMQGMVRALPHVGTEHPIGGLPVKRHDEIGLLARVLKQTHESLVEERELRRQAERHAILGRMTASMAHEIRNPACAIRLHAQLLDPAAGRDFEESKQLILGEAERIESLVAQWMSYARPQPPNLSLIDLLEVLQDAVRVIKPQADHAGVVISVAGAGRPELRIRADGHRIRQVLGNLLLNAIQAMPAGGRVDVALQDRDDRVILTIRDQGAGFSDEALKRQGEAFFSEKEGGMGLGLAVAREICTAHGGSLTAENQAGGGACLRVELMRNPPQHESSP